MKFVERLHGTLLDEHFPVMGRTQLDESVEDMQKQPKTLNPLGPKPGGRSTLASHPLIIYRASEKAEQYSKPKFAVGL